MTATSATIFTSQTNLIAVMNIVHEKVKYCSYQSYSIYTQQDHIATQIRSVHGGFNFD